MKAKNNPPGNPEDRKSPKPCDTKDKITDKDFDAAREKETSPFFVEDELEEEN